jgi:glutathione S-transferase
MSASVQIIGSYLSPYVRKVLVTLGIKGIPYEIDPIVGFMGDDRFRELSPLRRIPVLIDEDVTLADSSVICQYLDDRYPSPSIYPADIADRARARWLEEFADTRMGDVLIWRLFYQKVVLPHVFGRISDEAVVERTLSEELPQVLDYLETVAPREGFAFGSLSIADISVATHFRNAAFLRISIDATRWPKTAGWIERVLATEQFAALVPFEKVSMRTLPKQHREVLTQLGAPLWSTSHAAEAARPGIMPI